jgi:hypothetical protein
MPGHRLDRKVVKRIKTALIRMTAIAIAALVGFGVAEIGLRLIRPQQTGPSVFTYDPRTGSLPKPNLRGRFSIPGFWSYSVTHDALGMRVTGIVDRESARTRILLLGGSRAYGVGVNDQETFAYLLEERLSRTPLRTAVMNAGIGGKGTDYALRFFETIGRDLRPDLTILCFVANDFSYNGKSGIYDIRPDGTLRLRADPGATYRRKEFLSRSRPYNWLISWSHVANLIKTAAVRHVEAQAAREHERPGAVIASPNRKKGWANEGNRLPTKLFLERLTAAVREAGSDFLIVYAPGADEVELFRRTGQISKDEAMFISLLGPNRGLLLSLTPLVAGSGRAVATLYYHEDPNERPDGRWRATGHALIAGYLEGPVRERLHRRLAASTGQ